VTAPAPRRRSKTYQEGAHWRKVQAYVPASLSVRLARAAEAEGKTKKDLVIEALSRRLPAADTSESSDESGDD
jgi:hypothetical protein